MLRHNPLASTVPGPLDYAFSVSDHDQTDQNTMVHGNSSMIRLILLYYAITSLENPFAHLLTECTLLTISWEGNYKEGIETSLKNAPRLSRLCLGYNPLTSDILVSPNIMNMRDLVLWILRAGAVRVYDDLMGQRTNTAKFN